MIRLKNKKADALDLMAGTAIFLILNLAFFIMLMFFVSKAGTGADITEQIYSQKIAVLADSLRPGAEITLDISELMEMAKDNNYNGDIISIDKANSTIIVAVGKTGSHSYRSFLDFNRVSITLDKNNKTFSMMEQS
jgi:hypothetical protein